ncbi:MAG: alpha/beta fold hydrolase [Alphaproteobacteria bacterium]|nr:alpha/beta fold hydrolase [Alphaproteobacteria bacterium]
MKTSRGASRVMLNRIRRHDELAFDGAGFALEDVSCVTDERRQYAAANNKRGTTDRLISSALRWAARIRRSWRRENVSAQQRSVWGLPRMTIPIVFVHGAFCGGWAFDGFRQPFEQAGYECHAPNLPFHERGADLDRLAECGVREYAQSVVHYARGLKAPPILIGHSLGGLVAQVAATHMDVAGLILLAPSAPWGVMHTTLEETGNAFGVALLGDYWSRPIPPDYRIARRSTLDRLERNDARRSFARFAPESGRAIFETVHWWMDQSMAAAAPPYKITAPLLAMAGGQDHVNASTTVRRIVNRFPEAQADFMEFAAMSHWLIGEPEWRDVAQSGLAWLDQRGLQARKTKKKRGALKLFGAGEREEVRG